MNRKTILLLILLLMLPIGCTLGPKFERPDSPVPDRWPSGAAYQDLKERASVSTPSMLPWQEIFSDEQLQKLIDLALNHNRDLRLTTLNMERARAIYGIRRFDLFPAVQTVGVMNKQHLPADLSFSGREVTSEQYSVNLGITSWEIDFFGRLRSLKDVALEEYLATEQARRSARTLLISAVAVTYLSLAADQEMLKLADSTLKTQEEVYRLIQKRHDVGLGSELDLRRSQSQVETARGDLARYTQVVAQDENALNFLVGSPLPPSLLPPEWSSVSPPKEIYPGLSSEVLLQRPDVMAAEHRLKAAYANIGAARAAFFPRIALTTTLGTASADLSGLFKAGQGTWSFMPQIAWPIFDARTWSAYQVTKLEKEISIAQYEKTIQTAFREVADALAVRGSLNRQIEAQQAIVEAVAETYRLSEARYSKGVDSYLSVLDAQRSLYAAQKGLIALRLARLSNQATLYKVLGGGSGSEAN